MTLRCDSCHMNSEIQCRNCAMTTQHALNDANERLATANQRIRELEKIRDDQKAIIFNRGGG